jgi:TPR repeat protein
MKRNAVCLTVLLLANAAASLAQTDPRFSTKPAGVIVSGKRLGPDKAPVDLSRPEMQQRESLPTLLGSEFADAASRGEAWAQTKLGKIYVAAVGDPERQRRGVELLQQAGKQNDAEAFYILASLSAAGVGVEPSNVTAFEQMKRAADLGFAEAQFALGSMYLEGIGTVKDRSAALASFRKAADGANKEVMFAAGDLMLSQPDPEMRTEGLALINRAIESGHIWATLVLATAYGRGSNGLPKDEAKAEALLRPPAERGDADCQMVLASLYKFGDSFALRRDEAQVWLQRAADQGQPKALEILRWEAK